LLNYTIEKSINFDDPLIKLELNKNTIYLFDDFDSIRLEDLQYYYAYKDSEKNNYFLVANI